VDEMKQDRFFEEVSYTEREREPGDDLIATGKIMDTRYSGKVITYGLSAFGTFLCYTGLPIGTAHNAVSHSLEMRRASDNVVIW